MQINIIEDMRKPSIVDDGRVCGICNNANRDVNLICIVEEMADLWAIERTDIYKGCCHILGVTSAISGISIVCSNLDRLFNR